MSHSYTSFRLACEESRYETNELVDSTCEFNLNILVGLELDTEFRYPHTQISNQNLDIKHSNLSFTKIIAGFNQPKEGKMKSKLEIEYYHKHDSI